MRARSVFTATTISPSPPLRQRSACYTIRARRNFTLVPVFRQGVDYSLIASRGNLRFPAFTLEAIFTISSNPLRVR